ncbi:MAG: Hpt domain-containing protein [Gammaproteobacteria bacterium]
MSNVEQFPVIDQNVLDELLSIMEDEYIDILHIYLEDSLSLMNDIHSGFNNYHEQILLPVHTLKSSSKNVGARRLAAVAQKMEILVKEKNYEAAALMLDELQDTFAEAHGTISEIVKKGSTLSKAL